MAANFWASSQRAHWQLSREKVADLRKALDEEDTNKGLGIAYPLPDNKQLQVYLHSCTQRLGRRLQLRQQPLATAETYLKRFYLKVSMRDTNPYLMLSTCVYLACKMEECPQHIRTVVNEARAIFQEFIPQDVAKLAECEFHLISELNSYLIIHHPYRTLMEVQVPLKLSSDEITASWSFLNDSYVTDLILHYPPHTIAFTAIFLAVFVRPAVHTQANLNASSSAAISITNTTANPIPPQPGSQGVIVPPPSNVSVQGLTGSRLSQMSEWFAESGVDMEAIVECTQEMISLYDVWENFNEKACRESIARLIRGRQLSS
ncbi:Cyclin-C [Dactylella cylindrospora]|nr:Cyclin-C [Dactylella cylindrospora]